MNIPQFGMPEAGAVYQLRPAAHVLIVEGARIALVRAPIGLMLPGGGIDGAETHEQAAIRETAEECGLRVGIGECVGEADELVYAKSERRHVRKRARFFIATVTGDAFKTEDDHELIWCEASAALSALAYGSHRWALERWLASP